MPVYEIRKRSYVTFPLDTVHAGKEFSNAFLSRFEFGELVSGTFKVIHTSLQRANVVPPVNLQAGNKVTFQYTYNDQFIDFTPYDDVKNDYVYAMGLHETEAYNLLTINTKFKENDIFRLSDIDFSTWGNLKYRDSETIPLIDAMRKGFVTAKLKRQGSNLWTDIDGGMLTASNDGDTITYEIETYYFGKLSIDTVISVEEEQVEILEPKITDFKIYDYRTDFTANR